jgi:hypothetical protein
MLGIDTVKVMLLVLAAGITDESGFDGMRIRVKPDGTRVAPTFKDLSLRSGSSQPPDTTQTEGPGRERSQARQPTPEITQFDRAALP